MEARWTWGKNIISEVFSKILVSKVTQFWLTSLPAILFVEAAKKLA